MTYLYCSSYGKGDQKGIYIVELNKMSKKLSLIQQIVTTDYPSYLSIFNDTLFASYKNAHRDNHGGGIGSFQIQKDTLDINSNFASNGRSYTHLCNDQNYLFTANYHGGSIASFALENNCVAYKIGAIHHHGIGPDIMQRQTSPHVHCVVFTPDHKYICAVDLGIDQVVVYRFENGLLQQESNSITLPAGSGPRHMIFSKNGKYAYIICEISNQVFVYEYQNKKFTFVQKIATLPLNHDFSSASAIKLTSCNQFLFVSNRGHDSISLYQVNQINGKLSYLQNIKTKKTPRDFEIIDDQIIIVGAQDDDCLQLFTFDKIKQLITNTNHELTISSPVCIVTKK